MNYDVEWTAIAHDRLELIWMAAEDPRVVLKAANAIDELLARDPESREVCRGEESTLIVEPLAVDFHVDEDRRKVFIIFVWMINYLDRNQ